MAAQQTTSMLAKKLGAQLTAAHQAHKDAPVDKGMVQLPPGIRSGTAQLNAAYISQYKEGDNKGKDFFRASGIVQLPLVHDGVTCKGSITQFMIPLFDVPARGKAKAKSFSDQWFEFQNWFKQFGVEAPNETDPYKIEAYYVAAMKMLCDYKPFFTFSTRGWTPPAVIGQPAPKEMVFQEWHGMVENLPTPDPETNGVMVSENGPAPTGSATPLAPPPGPDAADVDQPPPPQKEPEASPELTLESAALIADDDPVGGTEDGRAAIAFLTKLALEAGATEEIIVNANSWTEVAAMCAATVDQGDIGDESKPEPVKGTIVKYQPRNADGTPKLGKDKNPLPAGEFEVVHVDPATRTVTLKGVKTKLPLMGMDKKALPVSWDHLED